MRQDKDWGKTKQCRTNQAVAQKGHFPQTFKNGIHGKSDGVKRLDQDNEKKHPVIQREYLGILNKYVADLSVKKAAQEHKPTSHNEVILIDFFGEQP